MNSITCEDCGEQSEVLSSTLSFTDAPAMEPRDGRQSSLEFNAMIIFPKCGTRIQVMKPEVHRWRRDRSEESSDRRHSQAPTLPVAKQASRAKLT
jgi:hypothetical protein